MEKLKTFKKIKSPYTAIGMINVAGKKSLK